MKRKTGVPILILVLLLLLTACGGASPSYYASGAAASSSAPMAAPAPQEMMRGEAAYGYDIADEEIGTWEDTGTGSGPNASADRKIVQHRSVELETKEFDDAVSRIIERIEQAGGYIERQQVDGVSIRDRSRYYERSASIVARIPAERLAEVAGSLGDICNVVSNSIYTDDITDRYFDAQARLDSMSIQEQTLLEILSKASELSDVITLQQALADVRYQIESLTATLKRMDSQVAFSFLNIDLREVVEYQTVEPPPKSFGERVAAAWSRSGDNIADWMEGALFFMIEDLPILLLNLLVLGFVLWIVWLVATRLGRAIAGRPRADKGVAKKAGARKEEPTAQPNTTSDNPEQK